MNATWLLEPVSEADPCGPDFESTDDPEFLEYYFDAVGRLPDRFIEIDRYAQGTEVRERPYDPARVDLRREAQQIGSLLRRSRDLRLLVLMAQWELLAGRLTDAADTIASIPPLLTRFGDAVHPRAAGSRREALAELSSQATVLQPMLHAGLNGTTEATLRRLLVATGVEKARNYETDVKGSDISSLISAKEARREVTAAHGALARIGQAASQIMELGGDEGGVGFSPDLAPLQELASKGIALLTGAVPELASPIPEPPPRLTPEANDAALAPVAAADPVDLPGTHGQARALLEACERFLCRTARSSPTLILVSQALELWGRPLVDALEILMPQDAPGAAIQFGPSSALRINIDRMRQLTAPLAPSDDLSGAAPHPEPQTRGDLARALRAVELYLERQEPSSPIPLLLRRARALLDKPFEALLTELIGKPAG